MTHVHFVLTDVLFDNRQDVDVDSCENREKFVFKRQHFGRQFLRISEVYVPPFNNIRNTLSKKVFTKISHSPTLYYSGSAQEINALSCFVL